MYADVKTVLSRPAAPMIICLLLAMLILYQAISAVIFFLSSEKPMDTGHVNIETNAVTQPRLFNRGLQAPFFGEHVPSDLSDIKQSMLDLKVVGIIFSDHEQSSHVIIQTSGDQEQIFYVGDSLPGGVVIKRITPEGVLVGRNGSLESLSLPKNELIFQPPAKPLIGD